MTENQQDTYTEDELALVQEVELACMNAIVAYLTEVADTMVANKMVAITATDLRAMASAMQDRIKGKSS
jgi:hypothetical protein